MSVQFKSHCQHMHRLFERRGSTSIETWVDWQFSKKIPFGPFGATYTDHFLTYYGFSSKKNAIDNEYERIKSRLELSESKLGAKIGFQIHVKGQISGIPVEKQFNNLDSYLNFLSENERYVVRAKPAEFDKDSCPFPAEKAHYYSLS